MFSPTADRPENSPERCKPGDTAKNQRADNKLLEHFAGQRDRFRHEKRNKFGKVGVGKARRASKQLQQKRTKCVIKIEEYRQGPRIADNGAEQTGKHVAARQITQRQPHKKMQSDKWRKRYRYTPGSPDRDRGW